MLRTGDAIVPGALLQPDEEKPSNSIIVLLPDGQRILYECFTRRQCARGFRVPSLYREPDLFAAEMLARVRTALLYDRGDDARELGEGAKLPRDEEVAALGRNHLVNIGGLVSALPDGHYLYDLRHLGPSASGSSRGTFIKTGSLITLSIPFPGIYDATIFDGMRRPRIDLFVVAAGPALMARISSEFGKAQRLLAHWNDNYQGWPVDELQRAYLESVVWGLRVPEETASLGLIPAPLNKDTTEEPVFSPKPGVFDGETEVTLHCGTPSAVIHFTVDSSEPVEGSAVYRAPIVVKGTELTIKGFATAPGRKDSAVVTGIFRIRE